MKIVLLSFGYLLLFLSYSYSQDTIIIVNGKRIVTKEYSIDKFNKEFNYINKRGKEKSIFLDNIFSIIDSTGTENLIYKPADNNLYKYSIEEMRDFIQGAYDASKYYKSPLSTFYGFIAGTGSTVLMYNPVYAIFPSGGVCVIISLPNTSKKKVNKKYPHYADNDFYYSGYNQEAKNKRFTNSIKGAGVGVLTGLSFIILQLSDVIPKITFK